MLGAQMTQAASLKRHRCQTAMPQTQEPSGAGSDAESEPGKKAKPRAGRKQQAAASRTTPRRLAKVRSGAAPSDYPVFMCEPLSDPSQHSYRAISYA